MAVIETLGFLGNIAGNYAVNMLPAMFAAAVIAIAFTPIRRRRIKCRGLRSGKWRELALFCFVLFCAGLGALALTPPGFWRELLAGYSVSWFRGFSGSINFIPLVDLISAFQGNAWNLFFFLGNTAMFIPIGFFPSVLWDKPSWGKAALVGFGTSLFIELSQLFIARSTDVNDLILNTVGALCGYWIYLLADRLFPCAVSKLRYERQGDPHGPATGDRTAHS